MTAAHDGFGIWTDNRPAAGNLDEKFHMRCFGGFENVDLLLVGLRIVARHNEHAPDTLKRLLERRAVGHFRHGYSRALAQDLARLVRVAYDAEGSLSQCHQFPDRGPSRITRCSHDCNHDRLRKYPWSVLRSWRGFPDLAIRAFLTAGIPDKNSADSWVLYRRRKFKKCWTVCRHRPVEPTACTAHSMRASDKRKSPLANRTRAFSTGLPE